MATDRSDAKIPLNIRFQLIVDAPNVFLSTVPKSNKMRANITGLEADQIENIVDSVKDAVPEAYAYLKRLVNQS